MPKVKICGMRRAEDAKTAAAAGADYIGIVFVPNRRRRVSLDRAREIADAAREGNPKPPMVVGLFADQPMPEVERAVRICGLDMAQLCGNESPDYCSRMPVPIFKVLRVSGQPMDVAAIEALGATMSEIVAAGHLITLDRLEGKLQGGSGLTFDWKVAAYLSQRGHKFVMAGGLTPCNVAAAIAVAAPWGVDVSSGVETDGVQSAAKIRQFITRAKATAAPAQGAR